MKLFMLDTDISSYITRRRPESLAQHFERHADEICVSMVTVAELRFGVEKSKNAYHHSEKEPLGSSTYESVRVQPGEPS